MDTLGRYYTEPAFSDLLVNNIFASNPSTILELGAGGGGLLRSAHKKWEQASLIAADIDKKSISKISRELPFVKIHHLDSLHPNLSSELKIKVGSIDVAICNPPYLKIPKDEKYNSLFELSKLDDCKELRMITSDIVFLAQNLSLIKEKGELGIILPDSLLTGYDFLNLRKSIIENHSISSVIELPEKIFAKTEALTHILILRKGEETNAEVSLCKADFRGNCTDQISIKSDSLIERMDFKFHKYRKKTKPKNLNKSVKLSDLNPVIKRGKFSHAELKSKDLPYIHTTTLVDKKPNLRFTSKLSKDFPGNVKTQSGDILLARVGRGCIGKVSMVKSGAVLISDCIYKIRVPQEYRTMVFEALASKRGEEWLKAMGHGVCAKVISKKDLESFPL